jgi:putative transposase
MTFAWHGKQFEQADMDLLREMVRPPCERVMSEEVDAICGAPYGERTEERTNRRNGHRSRAWDTRTGTISLEIPKLREGSYFPDWLLEPRRGPSAPSSRWSASRTSAACRPAGSRAWCKMLGIERISKSRHRHPRGTRGRRGCDDQFEFELALDLIHEGLERLGEREAP